MPIRYRLTVPDDIPDLFRVRIATWHNPHGAEELAAMGITPDSARRQLATTHRSWVAVDGQEVVGFATGDREKGEMWVIAVLPSHEGRGIGGELLGRVERWLAEEGWDEIWLTTDTAETFRAVGFYRHLGWMDWKIENGDRFMRKRIGRGADAG